MTRSKARYRWTPWHFLAAAGLMALGFAATFPAWADIFRIALRDPEARHVALAPLAVAWLVWVRRGRLRRCLPRGRWIGPLLVAAGWLLLSVGETYLIQCSWHGGAVLIVTGCCLSIFGSGVFWRFLPAFLALGFLVPVPGVLRHHLAVPLQAATAWVTQVVFVLLGLPLDPMGSALDLNGPEAALARAASGLHLVFALSLVSFAFAFTSPLRNSVRFLILVSSPLSVIFCNVLRLASTAWLYSEHSLPVSEGFYSWANWLMLPLAFMLLEGNMRVLRWALVPVRRYTLANGH